MGDNAGRPSRRCYVLADRKISLCSERLVSGVYTVGEFLTVALDNVHNEAFNDGDGTITDEEDSLVGLARGAALPPVEVTLAILSTIKIHLEYYKVQPKMAAPKRLLVDVDNPDKEVTEIKRNQYKPDEALKKKVLTAIIHNHFQLAALFGVKDDLYNLSVMCQVTSHVLTLHHAFRQGSNPNPTGKILEKISDPLSINTKAGPKTLSLDAAKEIFEEVMAAYGLYYLYEGRQAPLWYGIAAPLLTFMASFTSRMNEVRVGCSRMPLSKEGDVVKEAAVSQYGLNNSHHVYLEGITYPPHRKASLAQAIGPLTQLIMLHRTRNTPLYAARWKRACMKSFSHLPRHAELIDKLLSCSHSEAAELIPLIANIILMTGARSNSKAFFPFSFYLAMIDSPEIVALGTLPTDEAMETEAAGTTSEEPPAREAIKPVVIKDIEKVDHSGKGAAALYKKACTITLKIGLQATPEVASEIIFHSVWGTHQEDLTLLQALTGHTFKTRKELGNAFIKKGDKSTSVVSLKLIKMNAYSKLSQALPTDLSSGGQQQVWFRPIFYGKRSTNLGQLFSAHLIKTRSGPSQYVAPTNIFNFYSNYRNSLVSKVLKDGRINIGQVEWRKTDDVTFLKDGTVTDIVYNGVPRLFMGADLGEHMEADETAS